VHVLRSVRERMVEGRGRKRWLPMLDILVRAVMPAIESIAVVGVLREELLRRGFCRVRGEAEGCWSDGCGGV
jgi:hypothetical protein